MPDVRRAPRASEQPRAAVVEPHRHGPGRTPPRPAADPRGHDRARRAVRPLLPPPDGAPHRTHQPGSSSRQPLTLGRHVARGPVSVRPSAAGKRPQQRARHESAPARQTSPARRPRPRRDPTRPGRGARHGGRGRSRDRWPRPALGVPCDAFPAMRPGRSRNGEAGGGIPRVYRSRAGPPPPRALLRPPGCRARRQPARTGWDHRPDRPTPATTGAACHGEAGLSGAGSSPRFGWAGAAWPRRSSRLPGRTTMARAGARAGRADFHVPRR